MIRKITSILAVALMLLFSSPLSALAATPIWRTGVFGMSGSKKAVQVGALIPIDSMGNSVNQLLYGDVSLVKYNGTGAQVSLGAGFRNYMGNDMAGVYGYIDYLRTEGTTTNNYYQASIGGEYWMNKIFFGGNIFMPIGTTSNADASRSTPVINGNNIVFEKYDQYALKGAELETGYQLTDNIYGGIGAYYFKSEGTLDNMVGPYARVNMSVGLASVRSTEISLNVQGRIGHDSERGTNGFGGISLVFAPKTSSLGVSTKYAHLYDAANRPTDVVHVTSEDTPSSQFTLGSYKSVSTASDLQAAINNGTDYIAIGAQDLKVDTTGINFDGSQASLANKNISIGGSKLAVNYGGTTYNINTGLDSGTPTISPSTTLAAGKGVFNFMGGMSGSSVSFNNINIDSKNVANADVFVGGSSTSSDNYGTVNFYNVSTNTGGINVNLNNGQTAVTNFSSHDFGQGHLSVNAASNSTYSLNKNGSDGTLHFGDSSDMTNYSGNLIDLVADNTSTISLGSNLNIKKYSTKATNGTVLIHTSGQGVNLSAKSLNLAGVTFNTPGSTDGATNLGGINNGIAVFEGSSAAPMINVTGDILFGADAATTTNKSVLGDGGKNALFYYGSSSNTHGKLTLSGNTQLNSGFQAGGDDNAQYIMIVASGATHGGFTSTGTINLSRTNTLDATGNAVRVQATSTQSHSSYIANVAGTLNGYSQTGLTTFGYGVGAINAVAAMFDASNGSLVTGTNSAGHVYVESNGSVAGNITIGQTNMLETADNLSNAQNIVFIYNDGKVTGNIAISGGIGGQKNSTTGAVAAATGAGTYLQLIHNTALASTGTGSSNTISIAGDISGYRYTGIFNDGTMTANIADSASINMATTATTPQAAAGTGANLVGFMNNSGGVLNGNYTQSGSITLSTNSRGGSNDDASYINNSGSITGYIKSSGDFTNLRTGAASGNINRYIYQGGNTSKLGTALSSGAAFTFTGGYYIPTTGANAASTVNGIFSSISTTAIAHDINIGLTKLDGTTTTNDNAIIGGSLANGSSAAGAQVILANITSLSGNLNVNTVHKEVVGANPSNTISITTMTGDINIDDSNSHTINATGLSAPTYSYINGIGTGNTYIGGTYNWNFGLAGNSTYNFASTLANAGGSGKTITINPKMLLNSTGNSNNDFSFLNLGTNSLATGTTVNFGTSSSDTNVNHAAATNSTLIFAGSGNNNSYGINTGATTYTSATNYTMGLTMDSNGTGDSFTLYNSTATTTNTVSGNFTVTGKFTGKGSAGFTILKGGSTPGTNPVTLTATVDTTGATINTITGSVKMLNNVILSGATVTLAETLTTGTGSYTGYIQGGSAVGTANTFTVGGQKNIGGAATFVKGLGGANNSLSGVTYNFGTSVVKDANGNITTQASSINVTGESKFIGLAAAAGAGGVYNTATTVNIAGSYNGTGGVAQNATTSTGRGLIESDASVGSPNLNVNFLDNASVNIACGANECAIIGLGITANGTTSTIGFKTGKDVTIGLAGTGTNRNLIATTAAVGDTGNVTVTFGSTGTATSFGFTNTGLIGSSDNLSLVHIATAVPAAASVTLGQVDCAKFNSAWTSANIVTGGANVGNVISIPTTAPTVSGSCIVVTP